MLALGVSSVLDIWQGGRPVALPDVPAGKLACVSYTPRAFIPGATGTVAVAQLEADLALLAAESRCIRTYSSTHGMEALPAIARRHGLAVLLGIWIGTNPATNEAEIAAALRAAQDHADVINGIIVGNEVLLRREQPVEALGAYIERVNAATDLPVTYADVWEFWHTGAALAQSVDFITIHILPYWEDEPVGVDAALAHVRDIHAEMQAAFPGKQLLIGETGWPTRGRPREAAQPSLVNGARFVREFVAWANGQQLPYNVIEAFDQPWKRANEGTAGGYWGLYDTEGRPKYPLEGPVVEDPSWRHGVALAALGALLAALGGRLTGGSQAWSRHAWRAAAGLAAGALLYTQWQYVPHANRDAVELAQTGTGLLCGWLLVLGIGSSLGRDLTAAGGRAGPLLTGGFEAVAARGLGPIVRLLSVMRLVLLFGIAYLCLGLALDARYRDFPLAITALPALLLTVRQLLCPGQDRTGIEERMLAAVIVVCAVTSLLIEGPANLRALGWNASCLLLALAILRAGRAEPSQHQG